MKEEPGGTCEGAVCTYCLADARVTRLIDAAYENPTCEGDVEAEIDQHVPKLAAHTNRPAVREATASHVNRAVVKEQEG